MHPYREPALNMYNAMWCCVCREYTLQAWSFKHPSGVGSSNVCIFCIQKSVGNAVRADLQLEFAEDYTLVLKSYNRRYHHG